MVSDHRAVGATERGHLDLHRPLLAHVDRVVLDQGAVLMEGAPDEVTRDPRVVEAYLGGGFSDAGA